MKKGLPGTAFMVSCSVILASCSSVDMQHAGPPDEALPSVAYRVPKSAEVSENQRVVSASHAASVCRRQLECLAPSFSIIMDYGDSCRGSVSQHMSALAEDMLESGLAVAVSMESRGKKITFTPVYSDCMLILRAFHEPSFRRTLPPAYQQALNKAVDIVNQVCERYRSDYERAVALHDYLALHCRYDADLGAAAQADATSKLLLEGRAVCDGYAHAYGMLLSMAGIENRFVIGKGDGIEHIWNLVKLDNQWVHVDVTYDDPKPDKNGRVLHSYFGIPDSLIANNHSWNRLEVPTANADKLYYPFYRGYHFSTVRDLLTWASGNRQGHDWNLTVVVDELRTLRSDAAIYRRVNDAVRYVGSFQLSSIAIDDGLPGTIYCTFSD